MTFSAPIICSQHANRAGLALAAVSKAASGLGVVGEDPKMPLTAATATSSSQINARDTFSDCFLI